MHRGPNGANRSVSDPTGASTGRRSWPSMTDTEPRTASAPTHSRGCENPASTSVTTNGTPRPMRATAASCDRVNSRAAHPAALGAAALGRVGQPVGGRAVVAGTGQRVLPEPREQLVHASAPPGAAGTRAARIVRGERGASAP